MGNASWIILALVASSYICEGYKILVLFPTPGKSHSILGEGYVRHLLEAGHEVTYVTPFPKKNAHPKLHQIDVSSNLLLIPDSGINIKAIMDKQLDMSDMNLLFSLFFNVTHNTVTNENVKKMVMDPTQKFDVVIAEWMFSEFLSGFAALYGSPFIWSSSVEPHWYLLSLIDGYTNPAYVAEIQSEISPPFSFTERINSLWTLITSLVLREFVTRVEAQNFKELYAPLFEIKGKALPSYEEVRYKVSLILANSHMPMAQAISLPQNCKTIGGYHVATNVKPLPKELQNIMDSAKNGVIYFSLGSNVKSKDLPEKVKNELLQVFGQLKYTVLWKFEEVLPNVPQNVHILQWAPQQSILAHPNCLLFITHGGLLSTIEAMHFGVPLIGIPVFADQFLNVDRAAKKGFATRVDLSYSLAAALNVAIEEVLSNPKYKEKIKELSAIYHDRPIPPGKELVHWVEHVVRTRGAPHLRSPALHVPLYQKLFLDVAALLILIIAIVYKSLKKILRFLRRKDVKEKIN